VSSQLRDIVALSYACSNLPTPYRDSHHPLIFVHSTGLLAVQFGFRPLRQGGIDLLDHFCNMKVHGILSSCVYIHEFELNQCQGLRRAHIPVYIPVRSCGLKYNLPFVVGLRAGACMISNTPGFGSTSTAQHKLHLAKLIRLKSGVSAILEDPLGAAK
jgi:hypothetical protein